MIKKTIVKYFMNATYLMIITLVLISPANAGMAELETGWNLVSITPAEFVSGEAFIDIVETAGWTIDSIKAYNAYGYAGWAVFTPGGLFNAYSEFQEGLGYFVNVSDNGTWPVNSTLSLGRDQLAIGYNDQILIGDQVATISNTSGSYGSFSTVTVAEADATVVKFPIVSSAVDNCTIGLIVDDNATTREIEIVFDGYQINHDGSISISGSSVDIAVEGVNAEGGEVLVTSAGAITGVTTSDPVYSTGGINVVDLTNLATLLSTELSIEDFETILAAGTYTLEVYIAPDNAALIVDGSELNSTGDVVIDTSTLIDGGYKVFGTVVIE